MSETFQSSRSTALAQLTISVRPGEVVRRGAPIAVTVTTELSPEAARGVAIAGQRVAVVQTDDRTGFLVDTATLPAGPHVLQVNELWTTNESHPLEDVAVPFVLVDTAAPVPAEFAINHVVRLYIREFDVERLPMNGELEGPFVDVFKVEHRETGEPMQVAYDHTGERVDLDRELARLAERRQRRYGKIHPTLHEVIEREPTEPVLVAVWLHAPDADTVEKSTTDEIAVRPDAEERVREQWKALSGRFAEQAADIGLKLETVDEAAPIVYGRIPARRVADLAARDEVAALFLYEPEGIEDLAHSIAIANADDAHAAGATGKRVNVAV
jgi:hypothetical protein